MTRERDVEAAPIDMDAVDLGEGARWLADGPVQVDLLAGRLLAHRDGRVETWLDLGLPLGAVAPRRGGGLVAVVGTGVRLFTDLDDPAPVNVDTGEDPSVVRVNDATTDEQGRLWFGLMPYDGTPGAGSVWRLDPDLTLTRVLSGLTIPNGPVVDSARGVLYLADSALGAIFRHSFDVTSGEVGTAEPFATVDDASPDGMALDAEDGLWSVLWGGSRLHRYDLAGKLTDVVPLPVQQPTSVALDPAGGPALVTSARFGLANPGQLDGRSLWVDIGTAGPLAQAFAS